MSSRLLLSLRQFLGSHLGFMVFVLLFVVAITASTGYTIYRMHAEALVQHEAIARVQARAVEDHLTQSLNLLNQSLDNALLALKGVEGPDSVGHELGKLLRHTPALRSLSLLGPDGRIVASSNPANLGVQVDSHDYLPPEAGRSDVLRIGRPWRGRDFAGGAMANAEAPGDALAPGFIPVLRSQRIGEQVLMLVAALNPDYFINHYNAKLQPEVGAVDLLRYDGVQLMSTDEGFSPGRPYPEQGFLAQLAEVESGQFNAVRPGLGPVIGAFRASRLFPVLVVLQIQREHALASWAQESGRLVLTVLPALLAVLVLATWLYAHLRRVGEQRAEARQRERERLAATVFTHSREGIIITNADALIVDVNEAFSRITGYGRDEVLGCNPRLLKSGRQSSEFYASLWRELTDTGHWHGEVWNRRKSGEVYAALQTISMVRDGQGCTQNYVALFSDITPMKDHQQHLEEIAHYDVLTRLPNRALLADRLRQGLLQTQRRNLVLGLVFIDLDGFKAVNDSYGHDVGDVLLITLAQRMRAALREGDTLARIGGDEFVAILIDLEQAQDSEPVLNRLLRAAASPVIECERVLQLSASAGVAFYPQDSVDAECLMHQADQAMYLAKQAGKNCYRRYDEGVMPQIERASS